MIAQITPTLTACNDDNLIIQRMKNLGLYQEMERLKQHERDTVIFTLDAKEAFIWFATPNDSGYVSLKTTSPLESLNLMMLAMTIMDSGQVPDKSKMH